MGRSRRPTVVFGGAALLSAALYLACSWAGGHLGFPLDDAWIHQTYARNLVAYGQWAFVPGHASAGSTAPLWTLLLALGYALGLPFRPWTYALGGLCLAGTALLAARLAQHLWPYLDLQPRLGHWVFGFAVALEWHLVWAAASGMETLLFTCLALLALQLAIRNLQSAICRLSFVICHWALGTVLGLLTLTRPEGILLAGLIIAGGFIAGGLRRRWGRASVQAALSLAGLALSLLPYGLLNFHLSGHPWPNTFYAKPAEYAVLLQTTPWFLRLGRLAAAPFVGAQVLLLPGLLWAVWSRLRRPAGAGELIGWLLPLIWAAAHIGLYAWRLPVTYQHGRYLVPVIPVLLVYGIGGYMSLKSRRFLGLGPWALGIKVWALSVVVLFLAFWFLGARAYATDVGIIEEEMVAVAHWINEHTEPNALIAAHDIGAIGYFARRRLLDLAGLVSPEVVPFLRDESRLLLWLQEKRADYLVTFPSWYPTLITDPRLRPAYCTDAPVTTEAGGENMVVYAIHWPAVEPP